MTVRLAVAGEPVEHITRVVSGPSPQLAMLRALAIKTAACAKRGWHWIRNGAQAVVHAPGWIAQAVLSGLSTSAGFSTATGVVSTIVKFAHRTVDKVVRGVGRASMLAAYTAAGFLPGNLADKATTWLDRTTAAVATGYAAHRAKVENLGQHLLLLAQSPFVRTVATRSAATASALIAVHLITKGILATHLVQAIPALAGATVVVTSPWWALAGVAGLTIAALVWAAIRVNRSSRTVDVRVDPENPVSDFGPDTPGNETSGPTGSSRPAITKLHDITAADLAGLTVDIGVDGSILVHGIPADLPEHEQERLAHAAVAQWAGAGQARPGNGRSGSSRNRRRR